MQKHKVTGSKSLVFFYLRGYLLILRGAWCIRGDAPNTASVPLTGSSTSLAHRNAHRNAHRIVPTVDIVEIFV